jgi:drug/metabolite transporter (DMT)-like permease
MLVAIKTMAPFFMGGVRYVIAGILLMTILCLRGATLPTAQQWKNAALIGSLLLLVGNGAVLCAAVHQFQHDRAHPGDNACLGRGHHYFLLRVNRAGLVGRYRARYCGVALLHYRNPLPMHPLGLLALLLATISWALGSMWSKQLAMPRGLMSSAAQMLTGGLAAHFKLA